MKTSKTMPNRQSGKCGSAAALPLGLVFRMRVSARKLFWSIGILLGLFLGWYVLAPDVVYPGWVPHSAHWVRSSSWSDGWLGFENYVRFEAPYQDCLKAAEALIAAHKQEMHGATNFIYARRSIDVENALPPPPSGSLKWWFCPEHIRHGVYYGADESNNPQIWIDAERGVFYYRETD